MPKEKSQNPAAAQRKADKQKEIAKSKRQVQAQRNEKLARRNPDRLQRQIDELKELGQRQALRPKDQETLQQLERDVKGIKRAREALGDKAPQFPARRDGAAGDKKGVREEQLQRRQTQHLGKRRRDEGAAYDQTDPDVASIPMPRDTPPPIPPQQREPISEPQVGPDGRRIPHALPTKPVSVSQSKTVYSSAPQLRDLKKEAVQFMPSVVAAQKKRARGEARLLEPEEIDKLEKAGYYAAKKTSDEAATETGLERLTSNVSATDTRTIGVDLEAETRKFEAELAELDADGVAALSGLGHVEMEEVEDEGD